MASISVSSSNLLKYFTGALKDPAAPRWCGPSVEKCVRALERQNPAGLTKHHDFWDANIQFLTAKRTTEQIRDLDASWSHCRCDTAGNAVASSIHDLEGSGGGALEGLGNTIMVLIGPFVSLNEDVNSAKVARGSRPNHWPTSPLEIMPFGPQDTVDAIFNWVAVYGPLPLILCSPIVDIAQSQIGPTLITTPYISKCILDIGDGIYSKMNTQLMNYPDCNMSVLKSACGQLQMTQEFLTTCNCKCGQRGLETLFEGHDTELFHCLNRIVGLTTKPPMPPSLIERLAYETERLVIIATTLYLTAQAYGRDLPNLVPNSAINPMIKAKIDMASGFARGQWPDGGLSRMVATCFKRIKNEQVCCALDCTESIQTAGRAFSRCSGCSLISYCGRECQQRAWRSKDFAHRDMCAKVGRVYRIAPEAAVQGDFQIFEKKVRQAGIDDDTLTEVLNCLTMLCWRGQLLCSPPTKSGKFPKNSLSVGSLASIDIVQNRAIDAIIEIGGDAPSPPIAILE